jgi:hypothetical protein
MMFFAHLSKLIAPQTAAVSLPVAHNSTQNATFTATFFFLYFSFLGCFGSATWSTFPSARDTVEPTIEMPPSQITAQLNATYARTNTANAN